MNAKLVTLFLFLCASQLTAADPLAISHIPRRAVVSAGIRSIGYSRHLHILEIEFVNGAVYRYLQVARPVYQALMAADSKALYYDKYVKGRFPSVKMRPRTKR
jgi:hypothetical protein